MCFGTFIKWIDKKGWVMWRALIIKIIIIIIDVY